MEVDVGTTGNQHEGLSRDCCQKEMGVVSKGNGCVSLNDLIMNCDKNLNKVA